MVRRPIRRKVQSMVLTICACALALTSAAGIIGMMRIRRASEDALVRQMERDLRDIVLSKAELAEAQLGKYAGHVGDFARYIEELYRAPDAWPPATVLPSDGRNAGRWTMQRALASRDVSLDDIASELSLLGNLERIWRPIVSEDHDVITTVYIGTESGFMIAYDDASFELPHGETEDWYDHFSRPWYRMAREAEGPCFTDVYQDSYGRGPTITCAAPFRDAEGEIAGVVCMDILITDLYRAIVELSLGDGAYAFLLDRTGRAIGPGDEEDVSRALAVSSAQEASRVSLVGGVYYALAPVASTGWTFGVRIPEDAVLAPVRSMRRDISVTMLLFCAAFASVIATVGVIARKFSARLTAPIAALGNDVGKIGGGDLDHRATVWDDDEIGALAQSFNDMAASLKGHIEDLAAVTAEKERIATELDLAAKIQRDMLPHVFPPFPDREEFDLHASMTPAKEVGGDFYDFFLVDDDRLALVMADVSGKGVPAALFMVVAKTLIEGRARMGGSASEILVGVNEQLCARNEADLFVTVWLGMLHLSTGRLTWASAGHEWPALRRAGGEWALLKSKNSPPLGTMEGLTFRQAETELLPGDALFLYTDGVTEATRLARSDDGAREELWGEGRMVDALGRCGDAARDIVIGMGREIDAFVGDAPQFDDITLLALRWHGREEEPGWTS